MAARGPYIVYNKAVEAYSFGPVHPFRLDRGQMFFDCARHHDLIAAGQLVAAAAGTDGDLRAFHTPEYVRILAEAGRGEPEPRFLDYGLGLNDNPVFKGVDALAKIFAGTARAAGALACEDGVEIVFVPVGGFHHSMRGRAGGFCYVNDIGIVIEQLIAKGFRVLYIDIDAHHGDGVQQGFYDTDRVLKISFHETGRSLFPFTGFETEIGTGKGEGYNVNVPLHPTADDDVFLFLFKKIFPPLAARFDADVTVAQIGVDMMHSDPLTHLRLTNNSYIEAVKIICQWSKKLIAFGGGGYHPDNIAKGYTLAWAVMNRIETDADAMSLLLGGTFLGSPELNTVGALRDMNLYVSGPDKEAAAQEAYRVHEFLRRNVFHRLGI
jgi:acetoin utilization protein AcuC